ncbi:MAG TPA: LPS export ABC transporter periplasmic protein LptC [Candidatus Limnocylindrales bacterium]|nr:LPS export ABC transporter periplasmic protein LptC [Candidatus Limnocylindrales bacterium]
MIKFKVLRGLFLFILLAIIAISSFYVFSYQRVPVPPVKNNSLDTHADVVINDVELTESSGNQLLWSLTAKTAEIFNDQKETRLSDVHARFFDDQGKALSLTGKEGLKSDITKTVTITGNVVAVNEDGVKLQAHQLVYDTTTGLISSKDPVTLEKGRTITTGEAFEAKVDVKTFKFGRNVKTIILSQDENSSSFNTHGSTGDGRFVEITDQLPLFKAD